MNKLFCILLIAITVISCNKKQNSQEVLNIEEQVPENNQVKNINQNINNISLNEANLDNFSRDGLEIFKFIVEQDFSKLSEYIDEDFGLQISTEDIFDSNLDLTISKKEVSKIKEDKTIHDLYFSAVGDYLPYTNKQIFDQFFSFNLKNISEIKSNSIIKRDYISEEYNIQKLLSSFPLGSILVDIFFEPEIEGSMNWYHVFLVIKYNNQKLFLYGLGIDYMDF